MRSALTLLNTFHSVCVKHRAEHGAEARTMTSRVPVLVCSRLVIGSLLCPLTHSSWKNPRLTQTSQPDRLIASPQSGISAPDFPVLMQNTEAPVFIVTHFLSYQSAQGGGSGPGGFSCFYKGQITSLS